MELLDGTLKLRHCTTLFTMRFSHWSLPRVGYGGGRRQFVTPGHPLDAGGNVAKRVQLTKKTRPGVSSHDNPDPGHPTPRRWKRLRPLSSEGGEVGEVGVPRNLSPRLGVGRGWHRGRLEPAFGGNRRRGFSGWSDQPKEPVHWHWSLLISCVRVRAWTDMHVQHTVRTTTTTTSVAISAQVATSVQTFPCCRCSQQEARVRVWYLTMMVTEVGTNGIFVVLLRFALVTVLWSAAPNSVVFDVLPSAFKQYSSLLWFTGFVSAATLDAMLYAATGGPASRKFCSLLGFATAWFAFDFVGAATIIFCCFQPAFVTEMIFDRSSLQNLVSGHEMLLLFLVSVVGKMWFLAA